METTRIHIVYNFTEVPFGGANQFLKALRDYFLKMDCYAKSINDADVIILNSHLFGQGITLFNFIWTYRNLFKEKTVVHRVDGPVSLYQKNTRFSVDKYIFKINRLIADGTVFQSYWSEMECKNIGMPIKPFELVTINAPDPKIFYPKYLPHPSKNEKIKVIANSWSTNSNKGFDILEYLDNHLDFEKYEMTFIGRSPISFQRIKLINALPSLELANQLRKHHLFISSSFREACSNSLLEAIHCGCIPVVRNNSSHPEIIAKAGVLYNGPEDILKAIDYATEKYEYFKEKSHMLSIDEIGQRYYQFCKRVQTEREPKNKNISLLKALSFKWSELQFRIENRLS